MADGYREEVALPAGVTVSLTGRTVIVKGPKGEVSRQFIDKCLSLRVEQGKLVLATVGSSKQEKRAINSATAHVANMIHGVQSPYVYKLKVCSSHFPMTAQVAGGEFVVKNFLGEKVPRKMRLSQGVTVKVAGSDIVVESPDIEAAGRTAGALELLTFIAKRDRRIFQDGIHLYEKPGRDLA